MQYQFGELKSFLMFKVATKQHSFVPPFDLTPAIASLAVVTTRLIASRDDRPFRLLLLFSDKLCFLVSNPLYVACRADGKMTVPLCGFFPFGIRTSLCCFHAFQGDVWHSVQSGYFTIFYSITSLYQFVFHNKSFPTQPALPDM